MYVFGANDGVNQWDFLGFRTVTIVIHYHGFADGIINENVKTEFERIFNDCFAKCKKRCHTVKFKWVKESKGKDEYDDKGKEGHFMGFWPSEWHHYVRENKKQPNVGSNAGNRTSINSDAARNGQDNPDASLAVALAHEIGFHGIGGDSDWVFGEPTDWNDENSNPENEFVDSRQPFGNPGMNFSKPACEEICAELDID